MRQDVHRVEPFVPRERGGNLPCRRSAAIQHYCLDFGSQIAKDGLEVGDRRIDKKNFRGAGHDWLLLALNSVQGKTAHRLGR
ncbi:MULTISPECIES: hypothetical protein [unclassified Mesorhizobium]|uniref:hypothetical protein n=1 Tax=unclassified Mesorhizobium TaxID=325217 RepID=UPI001FEF04CB|nr:MULTISPECIES: hypothetical protein [unclassified Mesorhizobium]